MKVAISLLNYRPGRIGGAETYVKGLLGHLPAVREEGDEFIVLGHQGNADQLPTSGVGRVIVARSDLQIVLTRCIEAFTPLHSGFVEKCLASIRPDVVLFPQQSMFPKRLSCPSVLVVHDLQHLFFPRNFSAFDRCFRAAIYPVSMRRADRIVANSQWTRRTIIERCGVCPQKVIAIPIGTSPTRGECKPASANAVEPYLYYPAATYPHKGHQTLFKTIARLRQQCRFPFRLVLSGQKTAYWRKLQELASALGIGEDVVHLGFLNRDELEKVYRQAAAVVFPTEFEGFGIPVLEAVERGKKIICSRLEVFDEIGVPRQFQIDFRDPDQLAAALELPGPTILQKEPLTWDQSARLILSVLRETARLRGASESGSHTGAPPQSLDPAVPRSDP